MACQARRDEIAVPVIEMTDHTPTRDSRIATGISLAVSLALVAAAIVFDLMAILTLAAHRLALFAAGAG